MSMEQFAELPRHTGTCFELQGYIVYGKTFVQQIFNCFGEGPGFLRSFPIRVHMRLEMKIVVVHPPEVDMMNVADAGKLFQRRLQFIQGDRPGTLSISTSMALWMIFQLSQPT